MYNITDNIMMRRKQMRNKSITRFAAFFVAATMLFACLQVIAQPAANDSGHTYVLVDQPTDGGVYLMISRQSGNNFAVSGTAMPDGEGLVPVEVGVAGDYVVSGVNDSVLWQFNGSSESGFTVRNTESGEYLAKLSNTLKTSAATQHRWEHIIHTNDDSSIGDEPVMHNVTTGVGYILYRVNGDETYFDCFNAYQQCNIRLYERRDMTGFVPTTGVSIGIDALELDLGSTHTFHPQVFPSNATIQNVTYTSSDLSVARINPDGTLITGSEGTAQITVYDGTGEFSDTCTVTVASANPAVPVLYGYRMYSSANGIVSFSADDVSDFNLVDAQTGLESLTAMCYVEGDFYGFAKSEAENTGYDFVIIDGETFERRTTNIWSCYYCRDMTYDPETGLIYCMMATNATIYSLYFGIYTVNPQTLSFNLVGETNRYLSVLECTADGRLYGIDMFGYFCSVDKTNANCTKIAHTTVSDINHEQSMVFCPSNGKMYWMKSDDNGGVFFEVNLADGTLVYIGYPGGDYITYQSVAGLCYVPTDEPEYQQGDIDMDGIVSVSDALLALRCGMEIVTLTPQQLTLGDMDGDGSVNVTDAIMILRAALIG